MSDRAELFDLRSAAEIIGVDVAELQRRIREIDDPPPIIRLANGVHLERRALEAWARSLNLLNTAAASAA